MHTTLYPLRTLLRSARVLRLPALVALAAIFATSLAYGQLNGTYTIGGASPSYATIDAALSALSASGVSGPVTFLIRSGTYAPAVTGYTLNTYAGMSATNTVTFKPDIGATVTISGATNAGSAVFLIDGGKYYTFDGSNTVGGTTRDMTIRQTETTYNPAIWMRNDADFNVVKNCVLQGNGGSQTKTSSSNGIGIVYVGLSTATDGNDSNVIQDNTIGDVAGTYRNNVGVGVYGTSGKPNRGTRILRNDIVNFGKAGTYGYGVDAYAEQAGTTVESNLIHMTVSAPSAITTMYGIYTDYSPGYPINSIFRGNKIYKLTSTATNWTVYGMYHWVSTATSNTLISNNMISMGENGDHTHYGIYFQSSSGTTYFYNNSFFIGGTGTGTRSSYIVYKSSSNIVESKNNIFYMNRTGGTANNFGLYLSSTTNWNSDNNVVQANSASNYFTAYYSGNRLTLADYRTASADDMNSLGSDPRYADPLNGDLHIQTGVKTVVEGTGIPQALVPTDFDGVARNAATPDMGADEGAFIAYPNADMAAETLVTPPSGGSVSATNLFTPVATVQNVGVKTQTNVNVRYRILDATNTVVYSDVRTVASIAPFSTAQVTFGQTGNQPGSGNTSLAAGFYTIEVTTQLVTDADVTNDTKSGPITAKAPLAGVYTINKAGVGFRNFTSFTAAVAELNAVGVSGAVTFEIASGTYDATTETFPIVLGTAPGMNVVRSVTFKPAAGATVLVTGSSPTSPSYTALFLIDGGKYYTFDGSNTVGGTTRDMTIRQTETTYNPAIWMRNDADFNVVKNCVLQGNGGSQTKTSSSNGIGIVFVGLSTAATGNDSNVIQDNTIGDVAGTYRNNVGVGVYGTSGKPNNGTKILRNDIVNFGKAGTYGYGVDAYAEQAGTVVDGNQMHMTIPAPVSTLYGIYTDYSPGYPINSIFNGNKIYNMRSTAANWTVYGMYHWVSISTSNTLISNNMISLAEPGDHTYYGIYFQSSSGTTNLYNNSFYFGKTSTGSRNVYGIYKSAANTINSRNNLIYSTRSGGTGTNYGMYISSTTGWSSNYNLISFRTDINYNTAYYSGARATLSDYQTASTQDANSVTGNVPYFDPDNGELHIRPQPVFAGEGVGMAALTTDFDGNPRDAVTPDMGADEGNFNGGGITVTSPNGGEKYSVDYEIDVFFTANRPMNVRVDFSTDSGVNWMTGGTKSVLAGNNSIKITTPPTITAAARVRVVSTVNAWEADTSDQNFELVHPVFTIRNANGGEKLVPTDTARLQFDAEFTPPTMRLHIDYSTNNGSSWIPVDSNVYAVNKPQTNYYDWVIPNTPTQQARLRVKIVGGGINDISDAPFTITQQPAVTFSTPGDGDNLYVGEKVTINWTEVNTTYVRLNYSTDGGTSWRDVVANGILIPAYVGTYDWTIPNTPSENVQLKITNVERPRFTDVVVPLTIRNAMIEVITPNGGEKYDQSQPITVGWSTINTTALRLDYSRDNGATWETMAENINPNAGSHTFTPPAVPTKLARVRLVDVARENVKDMSDRPFEIMEGKSITVYTPAAADQIIRGTSTVITWHAPRIDRVNIYYSPNNGGSWQQIANNIPAVNGSYVWQVPTQTTEQGKIRIQEVSGATTGESGVFWIVEQAAASLRVLVPNGGESYTVGEDVMVRWSATGATMPFTVTYSANGTSDWKLIATVPSTESSVKWVVTAPPGQSYRVRVTSGSSLSDMSDGPFEVRRQMEPKIIVLYPNGGENLTVDSTVQIRWTAQDIEGPFNIQFSPDGGDQWIPIAQAAGTSYTWQVPSSITKLGQIRVSKGEIFDVSDTLFEISRRVVLPIDLMAPNGGEKWQMNKQEVIRWSVPAGVSAVHLLYSTNGGGGWDTIAPNVATVEGANQYLWQTPRLGNDLVDVVLVKVVNSADMGHLDISASPFSLQQAAGVERGVAGMSGLRLLGNYPNPFAGRTEIRWEQGRGAGVEIRLYQQSGSLAGVYDVGHREAGAQRYELRVQGLASGMYIYEVRAGDRVERSVLMVVR